MHRKLTITVENDVYEGLKRVIGTGRISAFLNSLARRHVVKEDMETAYRAMAADREREAEAEEWVDLCRL